MATIEFKASVGQGLDAITLGWHEPKKKEEKGPYEPPKYNGKHSKELGTLIQLISASKHFSGKKNETSLLRFYPHLSCPNTLLVGLGATEHWNSERARQTGAAILLIQKKERLGRVAVLGDSIFSRTSEMDFPYYLQAFCEGYLLADYEYAELKKADPNAFRVGGLELVDIKEKKSLVQAVNKAQVIVEAVNFARFLGDKPGNHLTPTQLADQVSKMGKEQALNIQVLGRREIEKEKMGLLLGVAKGSAEEPKFIVIEHKGGKANEPPIALVGKGITFDSGGISLKPAVKMEDMKFDMMGAAAVAGIMQAVAKLKLPLNVLGLIAAAENMPGGRAQKPGDVARSLSGKTVEVINTDAEGRLILADALEYAQKHEPQAIIDFATLTGAVVDAIGTTACGIMGTHHELVARLRESSRVTGERVWELPLFEEFEEDLKSSVADIKNIGIREAGASKGGAFLKFFVSPKFPWAHCDIAGASYHRKDVNYHSQKFASGVMVRLMVHLLENWKRLKG
ncbi:MAG: leucyl aminopeptidase [Deltaproteobacteria bacterium]|nr:leucyl aminopeptidase [Deltaproteobacteria bacterium]